MSCRIQSVCGGCISMASPTSGLVRAGGCPDLPRTQIRWKSPTGVVSQHVCKVPAGLDPTMQRDPNGSATAPLLGRGQKVLVGVCTAH